MPNIPLTDDQVLVRDFIEEVVQLHEQIERFAGRVDSIRSSKDFADISVDQIISVEQTKLKEILNPIVDTADALCRKSRRAIPALRRLIKEGSSVEDLDMFDLREKRQLERKFENAREVVQSLKDEEGPIYKGTLLSLENTFEGIVPELAGMVEHAKVAQAFSKAQVKHMKFRASTGRSH